MGRRMTVRFLLSGAFLALVMFGADVRAQKMASPTTSGIVPQNQTRAAQNRAAANPACQRILAECRKLGFIQGQWKTDNGLWKDCFDPVVKGNGNATRDGKPINVPVSPSDVQACRGSQR